LKNHFQFEAIPDHRLAGIRQRGGEQQAVQNPAIVDDLVIKSLLGAGAFFGAIATNADGYFLQKRPIDVVLQGGHRSRTWADFGDDGGIRARTLQLGFDIGGNVVECIYPGQSAAQARWDVENDVGKNQVKDPDAAVTLAGQQYKSNAETLEGTKGHFLSWLGHKISHFPPQNVVFMKDGLRYAGFFSDFC
jgi:hypothetical protein